MRTCMHTRLYAMHGACSTWMMTCNQSCMYCGMAHAHMLHALLGAWSMHACMTYMHGHYQCGHACIRLCPALPCSALPCPAPPCPILSCSSMRLCAMLDACLAWNKPCMCDAWRMHMHVVVMHILLYSPFPLPYSCSKCMFVRRVV